MAHYLPPGPNYSIYRYMSEFATATGRYPSPTDGIEHQADPKYRDYTPLNALVYRAIFAASESADQWVFLGYQLAMLLAGLLLLGRLARLQAIPEASFAAILAYFTLHPLVHRTLAGDDKALYFTLPVLCLVAARRSPLAASASVGLYAGWLGLGAAAIPVLPGLARGHTRRAIALMALATAVAAILTLADGADGLAAIANRLEREGMEPFAYSIWRLLPDPLWPAARLPVTLAFVAAFALLHWKGRISFDQAFVTAASAYLLLSNNTVPTRLLLFCPVLILCFRSSPARIGYLAFTFVALPAVHLVTRARNAGFEDPTVVLAASLLCNLPLLIPLLTVVSRAVRAPAPPRAPATA